MQFHRKCTRYADKNYHWNFLNFYASTKKQWVNKTHSNVSVAARWWRGRRRMDAKVAPEVRERSWQTKEERRKESKRRRKKKTERRGKEMMKISWKIWCNLFHAQRQMSELGSHLWSVECWLYFGRNLLSYNIDYIGLRSPCHPWWGFQFLCPQEMTENVNIFQWPNARLQ